MIGYSLLTDIHRPQFLLLEVGNKEIGRVKISPQNISLTDGIILVMSCITAMRCETRGTRPDLCAFVFYSRVLRF
jgi:hypothetical protein